MTIIIALNSLQDVLHLLCLLLPLLLTHLSLALEKLLVGLAVASTHAVPERRVLAVVVVKVEMVHGVACSAVDDGAVGDVFTVVDHNGPEIDEHEEHDVGPFLQREDEGKDVVGDTLRPAIDGVEGMRSIGSGHDPFVMWLV